MDLQQLCFSTAEVGYTLSLCDVFWKLSMILMLTEVSTSSHVLLNLNLASFCFLQYKLKFNLKTQSTIKSIKTSQIEVSSLVKDSHVNSPVLPKSYQVKSQISQEKSNWKSVLKSQKSAPPLSTLICNNHVQCWELYTLHLGHCHHNHCFWLDWRT